MGGYSSCCKECCPACWEPASHPPFSESSDWSETIDNDLLPGNLASDSKDSSMPDYMDQHHQDYNMHLMGFIDAENKPGVRRIRRPSSPSSAAWAARRRATQTDHDLAAAADRHRQARRQGTRAAWAARPHHGLCDDITCDGRCIP